MLPRMQLAAQHRIIGPSAKALMSASDTFQDRAPGRRSLTKVSTSALVLWPGLVFALLFEALRDISTHHFLIQLILMLVCKARSLGIGNQVRHDAADLDVKQVVRVPC